MPAEGIKLTENTQLLTNPEIYYLARIFVQQGVRKIRLTGGEPTVRKDIVDIIGMYKINTHSHTQKATSAKCVNTDQSLIGTNNLHILQQI